MAPFPEAEIMTIKRLEVALRKMDLKLLKDGAYKLHEKYHSGYKFEYLDLLKELYVEISNSETVPEEIKDILSPTIEDILSQGGIQADTATSPYENTSSYKTTSNSQNYTSSNFQNNEINQTQEVHHEERLSAFDAFSAHKPHTLIQSPFSAEPFREVHTPHYTIINRNNTEKVVEVTEAPSITPYQAPVYREEKQEENTPIEEVSETKENSEENTNTPIEEVKKELKTISIIYSQTTSNEKTKNIMRFREIISNSNENHYSITELLNLISEIKTQANSNVSELQGILERLNSKGNKTSLITNSQSSNFFDLFKSSEIDYSLINEEENKNINIIGLYGLSNLFRCSECNELYKEIDSEKKSLVIECPKCKHPMYPDFYASSENSKMNMEAYNSSIVALANSKVWLLVHPSFNDKITINLLKSAFKINKTIEEVYILDKDINVRENYKNMLSEINPNAKFIVQGNILEDFFNMI